MVRAGARDCNQCGLRTTFNNDKKIQIRVKRKLEEPGGVLEAEK